MLEKYEESIFGRVFSYGKDKCVFLVVGIIFALANGTIFPIFSLFLARMIEVLSKLEFVEPNNQ